MTGAADLITLAAGYTVSRHAAIRRYAELHTEAAAAVFFSWKLKPTQVGEVGNGVGHGSRVLIAPVGAGGGFTLSAWGA